MKGGGHRTRALSELIFAILLVVCSRATAPAFDVTACGQVVPPREIGVVQNDLSCPKGVNSVAVTVGKNAQLDLNGHTINGADVGVRCDRGKCWITGPGVISGATFAGIGTSFDVRRVIAENLTISDNDGPAISTPNGRLTRVDLTNVALDRNNLGLTDPDNEFGVVLNARRVIVDNVTASDNLGWVTTSRVCGTGLTLDGNSHGMVGGRIRLENLSITNSTGVALKSTRSVLLENATFANNDAGGEGIDLLLAKKPRLENTTCNRSQLCILQPVGGDCEPYDATWYVCSNDY